MDNQAVHVMTIANSIIGVSIIAMPYCFKQCGIILSMVILIVSSVISRLSCHLLLKSAIMARRRTFEFLAFHAFGPLGKFVVEIGLIGFLLGTCIAFFVVMGDLGPAIVAKMTGTRATDTLRTSILMALALFCVLPLGLLRNIDSLSSVCTATIGFYFCLVLKIIVQSIPHIFSGDWIDKVELWRPAGFLQCLPIFSMALFCQTQIFEIYQAIPNASLEKMNTLIRLAVNICTSVYIFVGIFGYIAFSSQTFTGNILMSFPTSLMSEVIKIGFVLSVAFSFPLVIFPCRASLYSLLYKRLQTYALHEAADKYIPEGRFKGLTFMIVFVSLVTGVMIPNIELVLGLVGSTIGIMVCVLFPAMCFICISTKNTNERILAQLMLFIGVIVMVLGTYANLYAMEKMTTTNPITEKVINPESEILQIIQNDPALKVMDIPNTSKSPIEWLPNKELQNQETIKEVRHEPPQPEEPAEIPVAPVIKDVPNKDVDFVQKSADVQEKQQLVKELDNNIVKDSNLEKPLSQQVHNGTNQKDSENPVLQQPLNDKVKESNPQLNDVKNGEIVALPIDNKLNDNLMGKDVADIKNSPGDSPPSKELHVKPSMIDPEIARNTLINIKEQDGTGSKSNGKKVDEVAKEAIEKEEKELLEQEKEKIKEEEKKNLDLLKSLEKHNEEQKQIVQEKKKILEEIKLRQQAMEKDSQKKEIDIVNKEKLKAVVQIEEIAKKAIEKLSGGDQQNDKENNQKLNNDHKELHEVNLNQNIKPLDEINLGGAKTTDTFVNLNNQLNNKKSEQENNKQEENNVEIKAIPNNSAKQEKIILNDLNLQNINLLNSNNNDVNPKTKLKDKGKQTDFKVGLTKENLVPLPIALSNNISKIYKNVVAAKKDLPLINLKNNIINPPNLVNTKVNSEDDKKVETKLNNEKKQANENLEEEKILNKEPGQIPLFDVLKTKAEKQENLILHREIRSVDKIVKNLPIAMEIQQIEKNIKDPEMQMFDNENKNSMLENSKESCDKKEKGVNDKNEPRVESTETPLIRMITKLSEPELVSLKIPDVNILNVDSILKPLKRDLKSYKSHRRK